MKLLFCTKCGSIRNVKRTPTTCECGEVVAQYLSDSVSCQWNGKGELLGFTNSSLIAALRDQRAKGDRSDGMGREFVAFVIPHNALSVHVSSSEEKNNVDR